MVDVPLVHTRSASGKPVTENERINVLHSGILDNLLASSKERNISAQVREPFWL